MAYQFLRTTLYGILPLALFLGSSIETAQAGFEFIPPAQTKSGRSAVEPMTPAMPAVPAKNVETVLQEPSARPVPPAPQSEDILAAPVQRQMSDDATSMSIIEGFGRDIPLALMLRQIVPSHYGFSFAPGIDQAIPLSWEGGAPWDVVLAQSLAKEGMGMTVYDDVVEIRHLPSVVYAPDVPITVTVVEDDISVPAVESLPEPEEKPLVHKEEAVPPLALDQELSVQEEKIGQITNIPFGTAGYERRTPPKIVWPKGQTNADSLSKPVVLSPFGDSGATSTPAPQAPVNLEAPVMREMSMSDEGIAVSSIPEGTDASPAASEEGAPAPSGIEVVQAADVDYEPFDIMYWEAAEKATLEETLKIWSKQAGVAFVWRAQHQYELPSRIGFHGTYAEAVQRLLDAYSDIEPRPYGELYPNEPDGPPVLIVGSEV